jgi:hypothetical protein
MHENETEYEGGFAGEGEAIEKVLACRREALRWPEAKLLSNTGSLSSKLLDACAIWEFPRCGTTREGGNLTNYGSAGPENRD